MCLSPTLRPVLNGFRPGAQLAPGGLPSIVLQPFRGCHRNHLLAGRSLAVEDRLWSAPGARPCRLWLGKTVRSGPSASHSTAPQVLQFQQLATIPNVGTGIATEVGRG